MNRPQTSPRGEDRFRKLADLLPAGVYETDLTGTCVYVNRRWCKTSGFSPEASLGRGWADAVHPDDRAYVLAEVDRALRNWEPLQVSYRLIGADGTVRWVTTRSEAMLAEDGEPFGVVGVMLDVSELHEACETVSAQAARYRAMLDSAPCGLFEVSEHGNIVWANAVAVALMGLAPGSDTADPTILGAIHPDDFLGASGAFHAGMASGQSFDVTFRVGYPEEYWHLRATLSPLPDGDGAWVGSLVEDTVAPGALAPAAEVRRALEVAHDINNLVAVINASAGSALARLAPGADAIADLDHIGDASRMISELCRGLLGPATVTAASAAAKGCAVAPVVAETVGLLRPFLGADVAVVASTEGQPVATALDRASLERVLVNLLLNAKEALPAGGGTVTVEALQVEGDELLGEGRFVALRVSDDGEGMDAPTVGRAFDPTFSTRDPEAHSGLGLSTVAELARLAGGRVGLVSQAGAGTTVTVVVPAD